MWFLNLNLFVKNKVNIYVIFSFMKRNLILYSEIHEFNNRRLLE